MKKIQPRPAAAKPVAPKPVPSFENVGPFDR
jgi:hypothetical protein